MAIEAHPPVSNKAPPGRRLIRLRWLTHCWQTCAGHRAQKSLWQQVAGQTGTLGFTPAFDANAVDITGAGDTFHGAFALLLAEGRPIGEILRIASAATAIKVTHRGARSVPARNEVERFLAQTA